MASHHSLFDSNHTDNIHLKVLIPSICGGAVIGKGGEGIIKAQKDTGTKVKISKPNEYFPGTTERVCLIQGDKDSILNMIDYINNRIAETNDSQIMGQNRERQRQTKIIIPNSSAGLLIGKEGETINDIKKSTGAFIQVSPKSNNRQFLERYVLVMGDSHQCHEATKKIINKVVEDTKLCSFPNINYNEIINATSYTIPDYFGVPIGTTPYNHTNSYENSTFPYSEKENSIDMRNRKIDPNQSSRLSHVPPSVSLNTKALKNILSQNEMSNPSKSNMNLMEIAHALQILAQNGCLCPSSSSNSKGNNLHYLNSNQNNRNYGYYTQSTNSHFPVSRSLTTSFSQMDYIASDSSHGITRTLEVNETYIGAILGAKGRSIVELQEVTDTNIKVSKKPTENSDKNNKRIVTITGLYENVSKAYLLINDKIQLEQARRAMASQETDLSES